MSAGGQNVILWIYDIFKHVESTIGDTNTIWILRSFQYGQQFPQMTTKDYPDISSFAFGNASRQSSDDFGKTDMCLAFEMQIWCYKHWLKCSDVFNTAAIFQCGLHRLTELLHFALKYLYAVENVFVNK